MGSIITSLIILILILNTFGAIITVFKEPRDIAATWAWLLLLVLLPGLGFLIYLFFGKKIADEKIFDLKTQTRFGIESRANQQLDLLANQEVQKLPTKTNKLVQLFLKSSLSPLTSNNYFKIFTKNTDWQAAYLEQIKQAEDHIHLEYYTFMQDDFTDLLLAQLILKAQAGLKVRIVYDHFGSRQVSHHYFDQLIASGGEVTAFFSSRYWFMNLRFNFRNHRQFAIIDGNVGLFGPLQGDNKQAVTKLLLKGQSILTIQARFFMDWNAATKQQKVYYNQKYFPKENDYAKTRLQIVSSGPDQETMPIKLGFLQMIFAAKYEICIQTPYFIPDDTLMTALKLAIHSGVRVKLILSEKSSKYRVIQAASHYYADEITKEGGHVYFYPEDKLNSRLIIVDQQISAIGTANFDIRSFRLNFETTLFIYETAIAKEFMTIFENNRVMSTPLLLKTVHHKNWRQKTKLEIARLFAPIL